MHKSLIYLALLLLLFLYSCQKKHVSPPQVRTTTKELPVTKTVIPVGKNPDAMFVTPQKDKLYVANSNDSYISIIDTKSRRVTGKIEGLYQSWGFAQVAQQSLVAVSTYSGQVVLLNIDKDRIVREKKYAYKFGAVTTSNDGAYLFVVATEKDNVIKINTESLEEEGTYDTGAGPDGIAISGDGKKLYVTNRDDGTVSVIDIDKGTSMEIKTGGKPELINPNADHSMMYVSNFDHNAMHIIDTKTDTITATIQHLNGPEGAHYLSKNKTLYIANFNSNEVSSFTEGEYSKSAANYPTNSQPLSIVSVGTTLYVSCYGDNAIAVIDL